jgi:hypothetical protein
MRWIVMLACLAGLATAQSAAAQSADLEGRWETRLGFVFLNSSDADFEGGTTAEFDSDTGFRSARKF